MAAVAHPAGRRRPAARRGDGQAPDAAAAMRSTGCATAGAPTRRCARRASTSSCSTSACRGCPGRDVLRNMRQRALGHAGADHHRGRCDRRSRRRARCRRRRLPHQAVRARRARGAHPRADPAQPRPRPATCCVNGPLAFDTAARTATVAGCNVELSSRELAMLELLLMRCGRVIAQGAVRRAPVRLGPGRHRQRDRGVRAPAAAQARAGRRARADGARPRVLPRQGLTAVMIACPRSSSTSSGSSSRCRGR